MTNFNISIVSDTVCPWCYVGHKKLSKAIDLHKSTHPTDTFHISWHPYYLNPNAPKAGVDKREMYASKFGPEKAAMIIQRMEAVGKSVGINFSFGGKSGNTRDSHRVIEMAGQKGEDVQNKVVEEFFKAYFEEEGDITSHEVLKAAAIKAGVDEGEVKGWLEGDAGAKEVDTEVLDAQKEGISGVPHFTVQGKYEIGGAQDAGTFAKMFEKVKAEEAS